MSTADLASPPFSLPNDAPSSETSPMSADDLIVARLAVVDDHAIIRGVFVTLVEDAPDLKMAWTASSLSQARERLKEDRPDFLVLDVNLPDGNGFEFASEILRDMPDLPVLMVSAFQDRENPSRAEACGARGYIAKEASLDQLVEAVKAVQHGGRWFMRGD